MNEKFVLPDGSHRVSHIQDYFEYFTKNYETLTDNSPLRIISKIENRITLRIKSGYYCELLTLEAIKLLESTKNKINEDKNGKNVPPLEINEAELVHCNFVSNDCQQDSEVLYTFVPNKYLGNY